MAIFKFDEKCNRSAYHAASHFTINGDSANSVNPTGCTTTEVFILWPQNPVRFVLWAKHFYKLTQCEIEIELT